MDDHKLTPEEEAFAQNLKNEFERKKAKSLIKYVQQEQREKVKQDTLLMGDLRRKYLQNALIGILIIAVAALLIMIGIKIGSSDKDSVTPPQSQTALVAPKPIIKDTVFAVILSKTELSDEAIELMSPYCNDSTMLTILNSNNKFSKTANLRIELSNYQDITFDETVLSFETFADIVEKSTRKRVLFIIGNLPNSIGSNRIISNDVTKVFKRESTQYEFILYSNQPITKHQEAFENSLRTNKYAFKILGR